MAIRKRTSIFVDTDFFNKTFEPSRQSYEKKLGMRLSQRKFTEMLMKNGFKFNMPKIDRKLKLKKRSINEKSFTI